MKHACRLLGTLLVGILAGAPLAAAQLPEAPQEQKTPQQPTAAPQQQPEHETDAGLNKEEHQRLLGVLPTFNVVLGGSAPPLTSKQKFHLFFRSAIDPTQFVTVGLSAGIEQAEDDYPGYHYGAAGYARRYGASYADNFFGNLFGNAILPSLLHQDPRYFRLGHGGFKHRFGYSLAATVRSKGDNGHWQFAVSNIGGNLIGGAISNAYYPRDERGFGLTIERGFVVTATGAIGALVDEFYPDAIGYLKRHRKQHSN